MLESIEILGTQASHWGSVIPLLGTRDLGNGTAVQNEPSGRASKRALLLLCREKDGMNYLFISVTMEKESLGT